MSSIEIDDSLLQEISEMARVKGVSRDDLVRDLLWESILRRKAHRPERVILPTFEGGHSVQPGVDLNDSGALRDLMDKWDAEHPEAYE